MFKQSYTIKILILSFILILGTSSIVLTKASTNVNLITNSSFETSDLSLWNALYGSQSRDLNNPFSGDYSLRIHSEYNGMVGGNVAYIQSDPISVTAGNTYLFSLAIRSDDSVEVQVQLDWGSSSTSMGSSDYDIWQTSINGYIQAPAGSTEVTIDILNTIQETSSFDFHIDVVILDNLVASEFSPIIMIPLIGLSLAIIITIKQRK